MFNEDVFQLKEPSLVRWLSYFHAVDVLIKHFSVLTVELEGAWRERKDYAAKGVFHNLILCSCEFLHSDR